MASRNAHRALTAALRAYRATLERHSEFVLCSNAEIWHSSSPLLSSRAIPSLRPRSPGLKNLLKTSDHHYFSPHQSRHVMFYHTTAWHLQQQQQQTGTPPPPPHHNHHNHHATQTTTPQQQVTEYADAEECDEAIEDLEQARRRARLMSTRNPPGYVALSQRIKQILQSTVRITQMTVQWLIALPARIIKFYSLPKSERAATYAGWWLVVKKEAKHYWYGTKLLGKDARIASRLVSKVLQGKTLSRRERQQLTRTTADIFRLVPMLVFVVIPFMELLLPVALKLFPNMLPSTFEDKLKKEEEMKRRIGARLEVARFLQDTVAEMASDMRTSASGEKQTSAAELYEFMKRVRAGESVAPSELLKFAKLFNDELTLDNLERVQLVSLCRFVGIQPFGTDAFLRARLRNHLREIKEDDRDIKTEGLDSLTEDELRQACRARGMRAPFGDGAAEFMKEQLAEWLDWSLNRSLPSSLLLLSRAFTVTAPMVAGGRVKPPVVADVSSIRETLSAMPDEAVEDVELFSTAADEQESVYERKLDLLEREEEMIREEEEAAAVALEMPVTAGKSTAQELAATAAAAAVVREAAASSLYDLLEGQSQEERAAKEAATKEARMRQVLHALAALASSSGVTTEREAFMDLVEKEIDRLNEQSGASGRAKMYFTKGHLAVDRERLEQALGQKRLEERVSGILKRVEKELDDADTKIGSKLRVLDLDNDGIISMEELHTAMTFLRQQMGEEELRTMLEALAEEAGAQGGKGIDVSKLMEMALHHSDSDDE